MFRHFSRFPNLLRTTASGLAVVVCYLLYRTAVVPWIEPQIELEASSAPSPALNLGPELMGHPRNHRLHKWFAPRDWELESPKILESEQAILLLQDYQTLPDGSVKLVPCSVVLFMDGNASSNQSGDSERAIVLRAPQGAIMTFDTPFSLRQPRMRRIVAAKLLGPISVRGNTRRGQDAVDLEINTRDIVMRNDELWTPHDVRFRWGTHRGTGKELRVKLQPPTNPAEGRATLSGMAGKIHSLELSRQVSLHLEMENESPLPTEQTPGRKKSTLRIKSRGPLRVDFEQELATFEEQVDIFQDHPNGNPDHLQCELLKIEFEPEASPTADRASDSTLFPGGTKLLARSIEAIGDPVLFRAPRNSVHTRCQQLYYDLATKEIRLSASPYLEIRQRESLVRAPRIQYRLTDDGTLGPLLAEGPGLLQTQVGNDSQEPLEVTWQRQLRVQRDGQWQLLSLLGGMGLTHQDETTITAEELWMWMKELPAQNPGERSRLLPDHLLARAKVVKQTDSGVEGSLQALHTRQPNSPRMPASLVKIRSPEFDARVKQLEAWFQHLPPATNAAPKTAATGAKPGQTNFGNAPPSGPPAVGSPNGNPPRDRYMVSGELARLHVEVAGGRFQDVDISIERKASLEQTMSADPSQPPLIIRGDTLAMQNAMQGPRSGWVQGQAAHFESHGLKIDSGNIHVDEAANKVWVEGPGTMEMPLPAERSAPYGMGNTVAKQPAVNGLPPRQAKIQWQQSMDFDGRLARFHGDVVGTTDRQLLRAARVEAFLEHQIRFQRLRDNPPRPRLESVHCYRDTVGKPHVNPGDPVTRHIFLENRQFKELQLVSLDRLQCAEAHLNMISGDLDLIGEGTLTTVQRQQSSDTSHPLAFARRGTSGRPSTTGRAKSSLVSLRVDFMRQGQGNIHRREMTLTDLVEMAYGPVATWEDDLAFSENDDFGPHDIALSCNELQVYQLPNTDGSLEIEAREVRRIEGEQFTAWADRITFSQAKELLILEGNGRSDVEFWHQEYIGGNTNKSAARRIQYSIATGKVDINDIRTLDVYSREARQR